MYKVLLCLTSIWFWIVGIRLGDCYNPEQIVALAFWSILASISIIYCYISYRREARRADRAFKELETNNP